MKIVEVSVNLSNLPSKESLIKHALKSKRFYEMRKDKALKIINLEIKQSGLFKERKRKHKATNTKSTKFSRRGNNNKQS